MIETVEYKGNKYPSFQTQGNAAQFAIPYAKEVCNGVGVDIGCNRIDWAFPGAYPVDPALNEYDAINFPYDNLDYVFSSHCLEHLNNWVNVLDYWTSKLKTGGVLFLYLPDYSQVYWRPWNNRKHVNIFTPEIIRDYMIDCGYINIFNSGIDLYNGFMIFGEKNV